MTTPNPYEVGTAWRDLVIAGPKDRIDHLLSQIEQSLPPDWERNTAAEQLAAQRLGSAQRSRCYSRHLDGRDVWLWLYRPDDHRVQGGLVEPTQPVRYAEDVAEAILDFRSRVLEPAAATARVTVSRNRLGPRSSVPGSVLDALWAYCDSSRYGWPPTGESLRQWREFVIRAHQDRAAFDRGEFKAWLTDKGWSDDAAGSLIDRLLSDAALLDEYDDLRQTA
jgi:hypothetical protein